MADNTEKNKYLAGKFGVCWHEFRQEQTGEFGYSKCSKCALRYTHGGHFLPNNPDFFNPPKGKEWELFGFLWERIQGKDWFRGFLQQTGGWYYNLPTARISCVPLAEALEDWFKEEERYIDTKS